MMTTSFATRTNRVIVLDHRGFEYKVKEEAHRAHELYKSGFVAPLFEEGPDDADFYDEFDYDADYPMCEHFGNGPGGCVDCDLNEFMADEMAEAIESDLSVPATEGNLPRWLVATSPEQRQRDARRMREGERRFNTANHHKHRVGLRRMYVNWQYNDEPTDADAYGPDWQTHRRLTSRGTNWHRYWIAYFRDRRDAAAVAAAFNEE